MTARLAVALLCIAFNVGLARAETLDLSFSGLVDESGFSLGGVSPQLGSRFHVNIRIDDSDAANGVYPIRAISYTLEIGTHNTITNWNVNLVATQTGTAMTLSSDPISTIPPQGEHLSFRITGFGPSASAGDPNSWTSPDVLGGYILIRGTGGFTSLDQFSGGTTYGGTYSLDVSLASPVPAPAAAWLVLSGLTGLASMRIRLSAT